MKTSKDSKVVKKGWEAGAAILSNDTTYHLSDLDDPVTL